VGLATVFGVGEEETYMDTEKTTISCPNCGFEIDVNEILYHQLQDRIRTEYNAKLAAQRKDYETKVEMLSREKERLEGERKRLDETIEEGINERLKGERKRIEQQVRRRIEDEKSEELKSYEEELKAKTEDLKELHRIKADLERIRREKDELGEKLRFEAEQKFTRQLTEEKEKIRKLEEDRNLLKISEKEEVIKKLRDQLAEAQRRAEQGSVQLQGEVQELAIEDWLKTNFPLDTIEEIKRGVRGADCLQVVNTTSRRNCGVIYYESKRTKDFQPAWIEKFKTDMQKKGAGIGVLVTEALPRDMERMGQRDGIWICTFEEFKGLCFVLRESIIQISRAVVTQENKGDKMNMLYDYLTSNEFKLQIEAIVEGFTQMYDDLDKERRAMEGIWKRREKQIHKVLLNTNHMYNSIRGIAGTAIGTIKALELPAPDEEGEVTS
jgi:hypothetical protein